MTIWEKTNYCNKKYRILDKKIIAHFLPDNAPIRQTILTIVELARIILRPLTLSFRLAANIITAGHVIVIGLETLKIVAIEQKTGKQTDTEIWY